MNDSLITLVSVVLVCLGMLAEAGLLWRFVDDWRKGSRLVNRSENRRTRSRRTGSAGKRRTTALVLPAMGVSLVAPSAALAQAAAPASAASDGVSVPAEVAPLTISTDRPGFSDSSGIVPAGHFQIESGYTFTFRNREGVETQTNNLPGLTARLGLVEDRFELRLTTSGYQWARSDSGSGFEDTDGWNDLAAGFKLKLIDQNHLVPRLVLEGSTTLSLGTVGVSNRDLEPTGKLITSWDMGSGFSLVSNANLTYATTDGARFLQGAGSAALWYAATDKVSFFLEYFVVAPNSKGTNAANSIDFGGTLLLGNRVQLDASVGFGLNEQANNVFTSFGVSVLF